MVVVFSDMGGDMIAMYSKADGTKWFTGEFFDRGCYGWTIDYSDAACPLTSDPIPCLLDERDDEHGPECFEGVRIQNGDSTWVLTGEYETGQTFLALEGRRNDL
jgi:hypothetical protein